MSGAKIGFGSGVTELTADANGYAKVTTAQASTPASVGAVRQFSENDSGSITGTPRLLSPEVSQDFRQRVGVDTILFTDSFNATAQNTGMWKHAFTTMTMTQSAGFLNVNAAGTSTVSGNYAYLQSWKYFPLVGSAPLSLEFTGQFTMTPTANEIFLAGLGVATGAAEPIDGCWFEFTSAGLKGCLRYNSGTVAKVTLISDPATMAVNTNAKYVMIIGERSADFWVDDVLYGSLDVPNAQSQIFMTTALPLFIQKYNSGTVGSSPNMIVKIGDVTVSLMDINTSKPWSQQMAGQGYTAQGQNGGTMGSNSFFTNNTLPTTALPVNTALTANLPTGLGGGRGLATLWNLAATDMILTQAQNPLGGVNQTPRTMFITGVKLSAVTASAALTAPAAGAHSISFGIYYGSSAVTLAQAESASFTTATTKAFRRKLLGFMTWATGTAPIGTPPDRGDISVKFDSPIVVNPGEYVGLFAQMHNGAATATGGLLFTYDFDHYFQ